MVCGRWFQASYNSDGLGCYGSKQKFRRRVCQVPQVTPDEEIGLQWMAMLRARRIAPGCTGSICPGKQGVLQQKNRDGLDVDP
jgi:hypothetical protein